MKTLSLASLDELDGFAQRVVAGLRKSPAVIYLSGPLGAGKTALVKAIFKAAGETATIKSPSYTLLEPYPLFGRDAWHLDLYRVGDPEELETLGIRDFDSQRGYLFVEWPENGGAMLPCADLSLHLDFDGAGRQLEVSTPSDKGASVFGELAG